MAKPMTEKQKKAKTERDRERRNVNKEMATLRDLRALLGVPKNGSVRTAVEGLVDTAAMRRQKLAIIESEIGKINAVVSPGYSGSNQDSALRKVEYLNQRFQEIAHLTGSEKNAVEDVRTTFQLVQRLRSALEIWGSTDDAVVQQAAECVDVIKQVRKALNTPAGESLVDHAKRVGARTVRPIPERGGLQFGDVVWFIANCPPYRTVDPDHHLRSGVVVQVEALDLDAKREPNVLVAFVEDGAGGLMEWPADHYYRSRAEVANRMLRDVNVKREEADQARMKWLRILSEGDVVD